MILVYKCQSCKKENLLSFKVNDRGEFSYMNKSNFVEKCSNCNNKIILSANDIKATASKNVKFLYILALLIDIILVIIIFNFFWSDTTAIHLRRIFYVVGLVIAIPFVIIGIIINSEKKSVKRFNEYYV